MNPKSSIILIYINQSTISLKVKKLAQPIERLPRSIGIIPIRNSENIYILDYLLLGRFLGFVQFLLSSGYRVTRLLLGCSGCILDRLHLLALNRWIVWDITSADLFL